MRITADTSRCVGAGQCVLTAPDVFDQDDRDGTVVLRSRDVAHRHLADVEQAVDVCPSGALALVPRDVPAGQDSGGTPARR